MKRSVAPVAEVPPAVVTVTSTLPAVPPGPLTVIALSVQLRGDGRVAAVLPKLTVVTPQVPVPAPPRKPLPLTVTVEPESGPRPGEREVTAGAGT